MTTIPADTEFKPQEKKAPPEVEEWGATTTIGMLAGMVYGGTREWASISATEKLEAVLPPKVFPGSPPAASQGPPNGRTTYAARRTMMEQRLIQISKGTVHGGFRLGALTGLFSGVQLSLSAYRGTRDTLNTVAAGAVSAGALGLAMPGTVQGRLLSGAVGTCLGGALAFPLGLLQTCLQGLAPPPPVAPTPLEDKERDGVGEAIERMKNRFGRGYEEVEASNPPVEGAIGSAPDKE